MRNTLIALALLLLAASASAQESVRCESTNDRYRECEIDGVGRVRMTRQLSDDRCIEGRTWGYRDGMVWVDKGCRAEFSLVERGFGNRRGTLVVCESDDGRRRECPADTRRGVVVQQQLSRNSCVQGRSWGYTRDSIWVDDGCRAEFLVGSGRRDRGRAIERLDELVTCESVNEGRRECAADTRSGVQLVRQLSGSSCRFGRDWGYDRDGIWVDNGCRAEFAVASSGRSAPGYYPPSSGTGIGTGTIIVCSSTDGGRTRCPADTSYGVSLSRQLSDRECERNRTWGYDNDGIWVTGGCRAEFTLGDRGFRNDGAAQRGATIVCESRDDKRVHCPADTRWGVSLSRRLSDARCERNRTWGYDRNGVWVDEGCRAEFVLDERR
jgi:hypothetical protein